MVLSPDALQAFEAHVLAEYPKEACGVLVGGSYVACKNTSPDPLRQFRIGAAEYGLIEVQRGPVEAVLHSHPYSGGVEHPPEWPTSHDMVSWLRQSKPWAIVATDGWGITQPIWLDDNAPEPLEGRQFIHGINDCYSLIRDWFRQERQIVLPNYARQMDWWLTGQDLYSENFKRAGFVEVPFEQARIGDVCLFQIRSPVINHAAVITGPNEILHHLFHRLSGYDEWSKWQRTITKYVRYQGNNQ